MVKLIITTTRTRKAIPSHTLVVVAEDGQEMDISPLVSRFTSDYSANYLGTITLYMHGIQCEHRTIVNE